MEVCVRYLRTNTEFLHYDQALQAGWPIATGIIEGAARHLAAERKCLYPADQHRYTLIA